MRRIIRTLFLLATLGLTSFAHADEGMWLLPLLQKYNIATMQKMGLQLTADDIYAVNHSSLKDAVVQFDNGCTGEVISYQGLISTNHHCGFASIQMHSSVENDYLKNGFVAQSFEEEIPTPGLTVTFLKRIEDVTEQVLKGVSLNAPDSIRNDSISVRIERIHKTATAGTTYTAEIKPMYGGNQYYLFVYQVFKDVRMVFAPPVSIGKFGGDTDNWHWPRHTGDFSIFRVYADENNEPAEYSPNNKPYRPNKALTISIGGYKEGDFAMIMGYPGSTQRYLTSWQVQNVMDIINTDRAEIRGTLLAQWLKHMKANEKVNIQYASKYAAKANYWNFAIGQNKSLKALNVVGKKSEQQNEFTTWMSESPERIEKYSSALPLLKESTDAIRPYLNARMYYWEALMTGCELYSVAMHFSALEDALVKNDTATIRKFKENIESLKSFYKDYNAPTDEDGTKAMLSLFCSKIPAEWQPSFFMTIDKKYSGNVDKFVDKMFKKTIFTSLDKVEEFLKNPKLKTLQKDPAYQMATSTYDKYVALRKKITPIYDEQLTGHRIYMAGILSKRDGRPIYPNANFTMRLTYGTIQNYKPRDGVTYNYQTTLAGVMEKYEPGSWEFDVPEKLRELYANHDFDVYSTSNGHMPIAFLSNLDITGGNSGSPVLNKNGHLIGLAFDGNWEGLSGDIEFDPAMQRCISLDVRYMLFIIQQWGGCYRLIDEMQIEHQ